MTFLRRLIAWTLCVWWLAVSLAAQGEVVVVRNVHLRDQPASTAQSLELLAPPTSLTLLDAAKREGYWHVRTTAGEEGWVWARNVSATPLGAVVALEKVAMKLSPTWDKPSPDSKSFTGDEGMCGPVGKGGDSDTNRRKNRTDVPTAYHRVAFKAFRRATLPYPDAPTHRTNPRGWSPAQLAVIAPFEGVAVTVEAYIFVVRKQTGGSGESTNCNHNHAANTDWHIALTENFGDLEPTSIVVETTPRVRKDHPNWTTAALAPYVGKKIPVRISGWTMVDPEHARDVAPRGIRRQTLWEIHPVTKIEVFKNGEWKNLDIPQN